MYLPKPYPNTSLLPRRLRTEFLLFLPNSRCRPRPCAPNSRCSPGRKHPYLSETVVRETVGSGPLKFKTLSQLRERARRGWGPPTRMLGPGSRATSTVEMLLPEGETIFVSPSGSSISKRCRMARQPRMGSPGRRGAIGPPEFSATLILSPSRTTSPSIRCRMARTWRHGVRSHCVQLLSDRNSLLFINRGLHLCQINCLFQSV